MEMSSFFSSNYFNPDYLFSHSFSAVKYFFVFIFSEQAINIWKNILAFFAIFFLTIICYTIVRMFEIRKKERKHLEHEITKYAQNKTEYEKRLHEATGGSKNEHWGRVLGYLFSQHSSDWKLAVIEADSMLETLLDQLGFKGETLGEKLKSANQKSFPKLTNAWEVHNLRNRIAHEGLNFDLSQHEAKRVVALYEDIFRTFGFI